jgi:PAS domain S-box-containing protein
MNIYTPFAFFAFLLSIYMGIYVIRLNYRTAANRVFLGLALEMAIWNFAYMFIYPDLDKSNVFFWYKITALGWANFPAFVLHFFLLLAGKKRFFKKIQTWILIYLPGLIFTIKAFTGGFLARDFEPGPGNALFEIQNTESVWYYFYVIYLWICILSGVLAFADYSRKSKLKKIKSQNKIFLISVSVLFAAILTTNILLPSLGIRIIPAVGNIILIFWMLTIWYTIVKFKLMTITEKAAANKLISRMKELLFFVDREGKIIRINDFTNDSLNIHSGEIINSNFYELVHESEKVKEILDNIEQTDSIPECMLNLRCAGGRNLPVSLSFSGIKDKTGDLLGTLIVGHDITLTIQLKEELENRKIAEMRIQQQNEELIQQKEELQATLENLRNAQNQLIQSEKMASLGELSAGVAHEIQNPLNFVNNFSEVSHEMLEEMTEELALGNYEQAQSIANELKSNLEKIDFHGKRADSIVRSMLQHSRAGSGLKEPVDINALAEKFLRLAYHGLRASDKSFNASFKTNFDEDLSSGTGRISVIPQDIGRVLVNLLTNAFYAVHEKKKSLKSAYEPFVSLSTKRLGNKAEIRIRDNGNGIPQSVADKIFQPFFTTKPVGHGTGLGLSISYDIIVHKHHGQFTFETEEGSFTEFIIQLPYGEEGEMPEN